MQNFKISSVATILPLAYLTTWCCSPTFAQVIPDRTLGNENSVVTPNVTINGIESDRIDGGAIRGTNLFHSFEEFNVQSGRGVYFSNPDGIANILGRVTGNNASNILGTLGVLGDANLFLINPNGIIFGPDSQLDINGSFYGSTAESLLFENNFEFSSSDPQAPPLLTVNVPIGLRLPENPASIINRAAAADAEGRILGLEVPAGNSLLLVGGDIILDGGGLNAPGGYIELGGLAEAGIIGLSGSGNKLELSFPENALLSDITLANDARVGVRGTGGGDIAVTAGTLTATDGGRLVAGTEGAGDGGNIVIQTNSFSATSEGEVQSLTGGNGNAGNIELTATNSVELDGGRLVAGTEGAGDGGNIVIQTNSFSATSGGEVQSLTEGNGNAGNIDLTATNSIQISGESGFYNQATPESTGNAGDIVIQTNRFSATSGGEVQSLTGGNGNAGNIELTATNSVELIDSFIETLALEGSSGNAGNIAVTTGTYLSSGASGYLWAGTLEGGGNAGNITVNADSVTLLNESSIDAENRFGFGDAGNIEINATNDIRLSGESYLGAGSAGQGNAGDVTLRAGGAIEFDNSDIFNAVSTSSFGEGGDLNIVARSLLLNNGSILGSFSGSEAGGAGDVTIRTTEFVTLDNNSSVSAFSSNNGLGGNIFIQTGRLNVLGGSTLFANVVGNQPAGSLIINASESVEVGGFEEETIPDTFSGSFVSIDTRGDGNAGNLRINTNRLIVRDGAWISANTFEGLGLGGTIVINASESIALLGNTPDGLRSSQILTDTGGEGRAGNIRISTGQLTVQDGGSISASTSDRGSGGTVDINASDFVDVRGQRFFGDVPSSINTESGDTGNAGNIRITTSRLIVRDGAEVTAFTLGEGEGGNLQIRALESVEVFGDDSQLTTETSGEKRAGNIEIETPNLRIWEGGEISTATSGAGSGGTLNINARDSILLVGTDGLDSEISTESNDVGNAGNLTVKTRQLTVRDGAGISAATDGDGPGGTLNVNVSESVTLTGVSGESQIPSRLSTSTSGNQPAGNLNINTPYLRIENGAIAETSTSGGGAAGTLRVNAADVEVLGTSAIGSPSGLRASVDRRSATGAGGNIILNSERLGIRNGGQISTATRGIGRAGDVAIAASQVEVTGIAANGVNRSRISAETFQNSTGDGGNLRLSGDRLTVENQGQITVSSTGEGVAGNLEINVPSITLENRASLDAETTGGQGNIVINTEDLILRRQSDITTNATGEATGGNITIDTENLVALENSDISANAEDAFGGRITINALGIFGTEFRDGQTDRSDITATSELGPAFSGEVNLNTPDVDPSAGLVEFDDSIQDISSLIDQNLCQEGQGSEFTITGQGGLPPTPRDSLSPSSLWEDSRTPPTPETVIPPESEFVEAQGWVKTPEGIQLIVNPDHVTPARPWLIPPDCEQLNSQNSPPYLIASTAFVAQATSPEPLQVTIQDVTFEGNTAFSDEELKQQLKPYLGKPITFAELIAARTAITQFYTENNYITSGAFIPPQTIPDDGTVTVRVVEGKVDEINVKVEGRLNESYIKSRLERATSAPLNQDKLMEALQLLQLDPLVENISAELSAGVRPDTSILDVEVVTDDDWEIEAIANNGRVPSVGSFRRGVGLGYGNLTGMGDRFNLAYANTDGSNTVDAFYSIPVNSRDGRIELSYRRQDNRVVEWPFERLDIESDSNTYEIAFRQPIVRTPRQEFSLGLAATRRDSQTSILGTNYPLSEGANDDGETNLSILRFFQEYQRRGDNQVFAAYSEFNLGLGIFGATVNSNEPDSRFFYWRGQGQWVRRLAEDTLFVVGADVQLSASNLVPKERFSLGGYRSVRGYRQDTRLSDSGAFGTVEVRLPIPGISGEDTLFQIVPFVDAGIGWNSDGEEVPGPNGLASVGLGLQASLWDTINLRLDYGIPLVDVNSRDRTWQEGGFYFSVFSAPF